MVWRGNRTASTYDNLVRSINSRKSLLSLLNNISSLSTRDISLIILILCEKVYIGVYAGTQAVLFASNNMGRSLAYSSLRFLFVEQILSCLVMVLRWHSRTSMMSWLRSATLWKETFWWNMSSLRNSVLNANRICDSTLRSLRSLSWTTEYLILEHWFLNGPLAKCMHRFISLTWKLCLILLKWNITTKIKWIFIDL